MFRARYRDLASPQIELNQYRPKGPVKLPNTVPASLALKAMLLKWRPCCSSDDSLPSVEWACKRLTFLTVLLYLRFTSYSLPLISELSPFSLALPRVTRDLRPRMQQ
jgi:hypothetical protein